MSTDEPEFGRSVTIPYTYRRTGYQIGLYTSALALVAMLGFPIYWMAQTAFKNQQAVEPFSAFPTLETFTVAQFEVFLDPTVGQYLINSVIVTFGVVITVLVVSLIAGYGLARFEYAYKVGVARFLLLGYMFSPIVLAIPLYLIWQTLGLTNSYAGLILALSSLAMPFGVWLMWKYIQTIPRSMEEAAWVAGAPRWRAFVDVVVPQTKPAMIANAIFAFAIAWGDFTFAHILMPENDATTFPPGLFRMFDAASWETTWPEFMAISLLITLPPLLFAFFLQSYLLKGFKIRTI